MPNPYNPEGASNGILSTFWSPNKITRSLELIAAAEAQAKQDKSDKAAAVRERKVQQQLRAEIAA